jgi:ankyrin repeat protein
MNYDNFKNKNQHELNELFVNACITGELDVVKYLLTSPELNIHAQINYNQNDGLYFATVQNHVPIVEYLLTSPELTEKANIVDKNSNGGNDPFISCCAEGHIYLLKLFLTSPKIKKRVLLSEREDEALHYATKNNQFEVVKYLMTSPDLWRKANPDLAFRKAYENGNLEMVKYLIFELNIKRSPYIRLYMGRNPNDTIDSWFDMKELNQDLKSELLTNESIQKKLKL